MPPTVINWTDVVEGTLLLNTNPSEKAQKSPSITMPETKRYKNQTDDKALMAVASREEHIASAHCVEDEPAAKRHRSPRDTQPEKGDRESVVTYQLPEIEKFIIGRKLRASGLTAFVSIMEVLQQYCNHEKLIPV